METIIFWLAISFVVYTYVGYPAVLWLWRRAARPNAPARLETTPMVSIIVTVRNEVASVRRKIEDLLASDYPADRIEIWVASDASTDGTNEVVNAWDDPRVRLAAYEDRIGKTEAINRTVPMTRGKFLVFMDARQRVDPFALRALIAPFADPEVGMVGGEMVLLNEAEEASSESTGLYWRYETWLRGLEAELKLLSGVSGCIFSMRRELFRPAPSGSILDDVVFPLQVLQQGRRIWWETGAKVYDHVMPGGKELGRRVRSLTGNYQLLAQFWPLFCPWRGRVAFALISHKLCRLMVPLALLAIAATSLAMLNYPFFVAVAVAQASLYGLGLAGSLSGWLRRHSRLANACGTFCLLNLAALVALLNLIVRGGPRVVWR